MRNITKTILSTSFMAMLVSGSSAYANAGPVAKSDCCDELSARIKKLEERAVMSDTKKIMLSGAVNRAMLWLNNGENSNTAHVNNDNYNSRLNITGVANINDDMLVGGTFEIGFYQNTTLENDVHNAQSNDDSEKNFRDRIAELFLESKKFGKLSAGRGDMASAYTMEETDLSGTRVTASGANVWRLASGASFYNKTDSNNGQYFVEWDDNLGGVFSNVNGLERNDRIRYDSPKYYGFMLSTSHGYQSSGDLYDVALRFAGKFSGIKVAADTSYVRNHSVTDYHFRQVNGSVGVLFPVSMSHKADTGINLYFGAAHKDWDFDGQKDGHFYAGKVGYIDQFFTLGTTAFAVDYAWSKAMSLAADDGFVNIDPTFTNKGTSWGVFVVQNVDVVATQVYLGYRNYEFKKQNSTLRFKDIDAVVLGACVKL